MPARRVRLGLGCLLVVLAVVGGFVFAGRQHESLTATTLAAEPGAAPYQTAQKPVAVVMGDSFAEGSVGVSDPRGGLARQFATQMGWSLDLDAEGGTGYTNSGPVKQFPNRTTYPIRMARHSPTERVSYVVITGGVNDGDATDAELAAALGTTVTEAKARWPSAKVYVIGPMWVHAQVPKYVLRIRNVLRAQATVLTVPFIDPVAEQWVTTANEVGLAHTDGFHPSQAGHDLFATRMSQALVALGVPVGEVQERGSWFDPATTATTAASAPPTPAPATSSPATS